MRIAILSLMLLLAAGILRAASFDELFADSTLRVDFILSGESDKAPNIAFRKTSKCLHWSGRRYNLDRLVAEGNADVTMTSVATGDTLYRQAFSTLFQEWLSTGDKSGPMAMENTVLLPMPRQKVRVTVELRNVRRQPIASASLLIDPSDIQIADLSKRKPLPTEAIHIGKAPDDEKIRVAILAEGYTGKEMKAFIAHAREAVDAIFSHEPFTSSAEHFDFIAIKSESKDSGVTTPLTGDWRNSAFDSQFSTFNSDRYLTSGSVFKIYDALTNTGCDHIIILANTDVYGGGGIYNFYTLTTARHANFRPVVVHEFGHSFGALGDEYFYETADIFAGLYPFDVEPWEANITTQVDFASKWLPLVESGKAALIEGGGYSKKGIWRGAEDCRMRTNVATEFCPVCIRAVQQMIDFYTKPL